MSQQHERGVLNAFLAFVVVLDPRLTAAVLLISSPMAQVLLSSFPASLCLAQEGWGMLSLSRSLLADCHYSVDVRVERVSSQMHYGRLARFLEQRLLGVVPAIHQMDRRDSALQAIPQTAAGINPLRQDYDAPRATVPHSEAC